MKLEPYWKRIAGMHHEDNGDLGVVWAAYDDRGGILTLYDCALFRMEVPAVIQYGITARGRHIPLAWRKQDESMATLLLDAGVNVIPEHVTETPSSIEVDTQEVFQRLRAQSLRVERRVTEWLSEYKRMQREVKSDGATNRWTVPAKGFPLIAATRHAVKCLDWAEAEADRYKTTENYPDIRVI
jgi:hypothetical protein